MAEVIGLWNLDETTGTFLDGSGQGNHGTQSATGLTQGVTGKVGKAVTVDGTSGDISIPDNATNLRPAAVSISAWFMLSSSPAGVAIISKARNGPPWSSPFMSWLIRINSPTQIEADIGNATAYSATAFSVPALVVGTWYHITLTYSGSVITLYLNGASLGTRSFSGAIGYSALPMLIGADYGFAPVGELFPGQIDQVGLWNRALTPAEVAMIYNAGAGTPLP